MITPEQVKEKTPEKFWKQVQFGEPDECWLWLGSSWDSRYGNFGGMGAHKYVMTVFYGEIEKGICALHKCDITKCVNPNHLFLGTQLDNIKDRNAKGRTARGENLHSKLTEEQVRTIKVRLFAGETTRALAKEYGVGKTVMGNIRIGKKWKHVTI